MAGTAASAPEARDGVTPWRTSIPGQPPSVNHLYKPALREGKKGTYRSFAKADGVEEYQSIASMIVKLAMPKSWKTYLQLNSSSQIRVKYWFHLGNDTDCSNAFKALEDAIAFAMGVNDKRFLPCAAGKDVGNKEPCVDIEVSLE